MAALVNSISSDVSFESVGSSFLRVILIGFISVKVSVAPEVGAAAVASPARVLELDTYSSSEANLSESSPPPISIAPMVSPFLCSADSKSDTEIPERHVSPTTSTPEILIAPILPTPSVVVAPSSEFPLAPVDAPPWIRRRRAILIRPGEDIPIALRYTSHHLDHFTSGSSSSHSSSDHSSYGHSISGHSLSGHTPPNTTVADSSTPLLARTPWCSKAYLRWDFSSESSAGPYRKRCRSLAATMTLPIHATRALVLSRADLLPPYKRFRDSISLEDSVEEDIDTDVRIATRKEKVVVPLTSHRLTLRNHRSIWHSSSNYTGLFLNQTSTCKRGLSLLGGLSHIYHVSIDTSECHWDFFFPSHSAGPISGKIELDLLHLARRFRDSHFTEDSVAGGHLIWICEVDVRSQGIGRGFKDKVESVLEYYIGWSRIMLPWNRYSLKPKACKCPVQIEDIETGQRELESSSLIVGGERASLLEQVASLEKSNVRLRGTMMMERARANRFWRRVRFMKSELRQIRRFRYYNRMRFRRLETFATRRLEAIEELVNQRVEEALAAYKATRAANALEAESQSQNAAMKR
ncbi:hypothetical protein Tco_0744307 [Tanacetum coccineum]